MSGEAGGGYFYPDSEDECDDDWACSFCDGEPYMMECDDPIGCPCLGRGGHCDACGSTGLARHQVIW